MRPFRAANETMPYPDRMKPFNFLLTCFPDPIYGTPPVVDPLRFRLVAPYDPDPSKWVDLPWYDAHTGNRYRITAVEESGPGLVRVKSYRQVFEEHLAHEEAKSIAPDGGPCRRETRGLLRRGSIQILGSPRHIGKEGNRLEGRILGEVIDEGEFQNDYGDREWDDFVTIVRPALGTFPAARLAEMCGLDRTTVKRIRSGRSPGSPDSRARLTEAAAELAHEWLEITSAKTSRNDLAHLSLYLKRLGQQST